MGSKPGKTVPVSRTMTRKLLGTCTCWWCANSGENGLDVVQGMALP